MKSLIAVLIVALVTPALAQNAKVKSPFVGGVGAMPCDKWLSERERGTSILAVGLESWVMGFVSGSYNSEGHGVDVNEEDVLARTVFYCRQHRTDILFQAALQSAKSPPGVSNVKPALQGFFTIS